MRLALSDKRHLLRSQIDPLKRSSVGGTNRKRSEKCGITDSNCRAGEYVHRHRHEGRRRNCTSAGIRPTNTTTPQTEPPPTRESFAMTQRTAAPGTGSGANTVQIVNGRTENKRQRGRKTRAKANRGGGGSRAEKATFTENTLEATGRAELTEHHTEPGSAVRIGRAVRVGATLGRVRVAAAARIVNAARVRRSITGRVWLRRRTHPIVPTGIPRIRIRTVRVWVRWARVRVRRPHRLRGGNPRTVDAARRTVSGRRSGLVRRYGTSFNLFSEAVPVRSEALDVRL